VIASAVAVIAKGGRLTHVASQPPLTLRRLYDPDPDRCALGLVGSAAGPLAGDELSLRLELLDDAVASLVAAGASLAQGSGGIPARVRTSVRLADGAKLDATPGPLIVCAGAAVQVHLDIELAPSAVLIWRETLVLGRTGEPGGAVALHWNVSQDGRPLLRQTVDLTDPDHARWPGALGRHRTVTTELRVNTEAAHTIVHSDRDVTQQLSAIASLRTTLA
jgi:urease accessory protein